MIEVLDLRTTEAPTLTPAEAAGSLALGDALLFDEDLFAGLDDVDAEDAAPAAFSSNLGVAAFSSNLKATAFSSQL
ncbi:MAG: hypothetical protein ACQR33_01745 [Candidatus Saccharibacteria bacterium]